MVYTLVALGPVALFILYQKRYFVLPPDLATWCWFSISIVLTALLQFFISFTMALLAFWVLEVATFIFIAFAFEYIAGGHLFPLNILPPAIATVLNYTPFPYLLFFPVSIYLGQTSGPALWRGFAIQAFWLVAAYALARFVWSRGIRKYSAVGG